MLEKTDLTPFVSPVVLCGHGVRLEPLALVHEAALCQAASDGELWNLHFSSVPQPDQTRAYIENALLMQAQGSRFAFVVMNEATGAVLGSTSYHDVLPAVKRLEIGYTWLAKSVQRTHVNTACKVLLLTHAFEVLGCHVVGWRTDAINLISQRAIERLGAKKDGVLRGHALRRDGSIRDTVVYSMLASEWAGARSRLLG
jgi:N-acetyltransferase